MDAHERQFVCNKTATPEIENAFDSIIAFQKHAQTETKFINERIKALKNEKDQKWQNLWDVAQQEGLIDKTLKREDFSMEMIANQTQLMIEKRCDGHGLPSFIKDLMKHGQIIQIDNEED